ncbi:helix-turn-helix domain-containing protein [Lederbergia panacisoli]|uniref:helix-turn-helix domain-containing protein n=1 Tax=Lederbergia panacisoli TaxID=1255251 RepID=UPI00214A9788|nr:helix-turn-helix domain-containing protein [Lederbergia panacisoli]MCR2822995.1 helix-turn-helix domain-containing protein [Lederbergia panacisoli]
MVKFKIKKPYLFYKYLISYFIIFLIPYLTISIIFYQMSVSSLQEEIIQSNYSQLEQVRDLTDSRMEELKNIATRISTDHRLTPYMVRQPYYNIEAIQELSKYQVNSSLIDDLYLYYDEDDYIYSPKGVTTVDTVIKYDHKLKESEITKFKETIYSESQPVIYPLELKSDKKQSPKNIIAYFYPVPPGSSISYGKVIFFVKQETLTKLINNILGDFQGNIYIFNKENEILASDNNGKLLDSSALYGLANSDTKVINENINNEKYSLVRIKSDISGWTFVTAIPTAQFYGKLSALKKMIISIFSIIAVFGVISAFLLSVRQYRPIENIAQYLKSNQRTGLIKKSKDELEIIRDSIELMFQDSKKLEERVIEQKPFVRAQFLLKMIKGNIKVDMETLSEEAHLSFNGNSYFVMVISYKGNDENDFYGREGMVDLLSKVSFQGCVGYGVELFHEKAIALIVSIGDEQDLQLRSLYFEKMKEIIASAGSGLVPKIGVGNVHQGMENINHSYIEALASIEFNLVTNSNIVFFDEITLKMGRNIWYPAEYQVKFTQSLKQGDFHLAIENLESIFQYLRNEEISIPLIRCMCFDIINTVLKYLAELEIIHKVQNIDRIVDFQSLEELKFSLIKMIKLVCEEVDIRKESNNIQLRNDIIAYIQNEYKSNNLNLELLAATFSLSTSYISRFIKEQTGFTFTQYIWNLRSEEFKRQLLETNLPIREIVKDIGYVDVANFTRKFRNEEGLTPGQYRQYLSS